MTQASARSLRGLNTLNFSVAFMQAGFGTFVAVRLASAGWDDGAIGWVLAAGLVAQMLAQLPSGATIDRIQAKRALAAAAILAIIAAAVAMAVTDGFVPTLLSQLVHGAAGVGLSVSIAAITLSLSQQATLGERLGTNVRYAAIGAATGSGLLGLAGSHITVPIMFALAALAGVVALLALRAIHPVDLATAHVRSTHRTLHFHGHHHAGPLTPFRKLLHSRPLMLLLLVVLLFQLGNAMLFNLAATGIARMSGMDASEVIGGIGIGAQLVNAALSPPVGRWAQRFGRPRVLALGLCAVPVRALLFAAGGPPWVTLVAQLLDGVSAATVGVLLPLVVADITHRGGRFNLALGMAGLASATGAVLSTSIAGVIAQHLGLTVAFLALASAAAAAVVVAAAFLPETADLPTPMPATTQAGPSRDPAIPDSRSALP